LIETHWREDYTERGATDTALELTLEPAKEKVRELLGELFEEE
jgi:hypothetical protein